MNIGKIISETRKKKGLKQIELAKLCNMSQSYLSNIEKGNKDPHLSTLRNISSALDVPLPVLLFLSITDEDVPLEKKEVLEFISANFSPILENNFI